MTIYREKPKKRTRKFNQKYKMVIQYNIITVINKDNNVHSSLFGLSSVRIYNSISKRQHLLHNIINKYKFIKVPSIN